jgi:TonB-linked SusC/RagA family outer membrane protein
MYYNSTLFANRVRELYTPKLTKKLIFMMKVNTLVLIIALLTLGSLKASFVFGQRLSEVTVSIQLNNSSLQTALSKIEQQTDFRFAYRKSDISNIKNLNLSEANRTVQQLLEQLLSGTGLSYKQVNNSIIIQEAKPVNKQTPRQQQVTGKVTDEQGIAIPGASVKVKGTNNGVITDANGRFSINAEANDILVFSFIGYVSIEQRAGNAEINISLKPDVGTLDAVVVVGYGTTTKRTNTGSVTTIGAKDIESRPVNDPLAALQGQVAGLDISAVTGYPGSGYKVRLRGENSIGAGLDPLYIVDGVPFISTSLSQYGSAYGNQSPLSSINPADIEQIDILKDADATAIYGSRAANGVILITTKKGKAGKAQFNVNAYTGVSKANNPVKMLSTAEYLELRREAFANDGVTPTASNAPDLMEWDQNLDQKWIDKLIGNSAQLTEISASLRGGTEQTNFLIGGTFRDEKTVLPGNLGYKKGALNLSLNHSSVDQRLKITTSLKYLTDENNSLPTDLTSFFNLAPNAPIYNADGSYYWYGNDQNPIAYLHRTSSFKTQNILADLNASYKLLKNLTVRLTGGFNRYSINQLQTYPKLSFNPQTYSGSLAYYGNGYQNSYILEPQADYSIDLGKGKLTALIGGTWQHSLTESQSVNGSGYISDGMLGNLTAATTVTPRSYDYVKYRYNSVFGRLTYNLEDKYILNGTFRRDGSSRFGPEKQFGNFGSVGAAWLFSNESFMKGASFLSFGKLRASWGIVGNDQIGAYQYLDSWSPASFPYGGSGAISPTRFANPLYSWEETQKFELGLDLGFLNDRLLLTTNFYRNRTDNQLIDYALSPQSGFSGFTSNLPALVQNQGIEFELVSHNIKNQNFSWNTSLNLTFSKNKLLEYPDLESSSYANTFEIGQPLSIVKGFDFIGLDPQTGVPQFRDVNGVDGITDPEDLVTMGYSAPKFFGGIQNNFTYKNFSLDFFFQFVKQEGPGLNYGYLSYSNGVRMNKDESALDRWRQPGDMASIPGASANSGQPIYNAYQTYYRLSNANWVDASFIRLKNVSLRYNFGKVLNKSFLNNLTVYVQGQNLFTITNYDGFDPETKGYALPPLRTITAGLQASF